MTTRFKTTKLLSGGRVTMPQEWLDRSEIKDGDILIIDDIDKKTIKITKAKVGKA